MTSLLLDKPLFYDMLARNRNHTGASLNTILKVSIESCASLKKESIFGKSDPYIKLGDFNGMAIQGPYAKANGERTSKPGTAEGRVVDDTQDPEFREDFYFLVEEKVSRCKCTIWSKGTISDSKLGTQLLNFSSGMSGGDTVKLVPEGTLTYTFSRAPVAKAFQMAADSKDAWVKDAHPTRMKRLIGITLFNGCNLAKGRQQYYLKLTEFKNGDGSYMPVDGGTYTSGDMRGKKAKSNISESSNGTGVWNESFVFLAPPVCGDGPQSCTVKLYDQDLLKDDKLSEAILTFDERGAMFNLEMSNGGSLKVQYATVDLDVGASYDAGEERAELEAALAAKAEAERIAAEEEQARLAAEAQQEAERVAAALALKKAEEEAEKERLRLEAEAAEAAAEEAERIQAELEAKRAAAEEEAARMKAELEAAEARIAAAEAAAEAARLEKEAAEAARKREKMHEGWKRESCGGEHVGAQRGKLPWTDIDQVIDSALDMGLVPGVNLRYIAEHEGTAYLFGAPYQHNERLSKAEGCTHLWTQTPIPCGEPLRVLSATGGDNIAGLDLTITQKDESSWVLGTLNGPFAKMLLLRAMEHNGYWYIGVDSARFVNSGSYDDPLALWESADPFGLAFLGHDCNGYGVDSICVSTMNPILNNGGPATFESTWRFDRTDFTWRQANGERCGARFPTATSGGEVDAAGVEEAIIYCLRCGYKPGEDVISCINIPPSSGLYLYGEGKESGVAPTHCYKFTRL